MLDQVTRYTGHVHGFPCEDAHVVPQKLDERAFLFVSEVRGDPGGLGRITQDQFYLL